MSPETLAWVKTAHVFGFITWVGAMLGCSLALRQAATAEAPASTALASLAQRLAMAMDGGAAIAVLAGAGLLYGLWSLGVSPLEPPWMHAKLTLVVLGLLGSHVFLRLRVRGLRGGEPKPLPPFLFPVIHLVLVGILIMAIVKPF
jgi:uncharacterized membrane protein